MQPQPDGGEGVGGKGLEVHGMRGGTARSVFALKAVCGVSLWQLGARSHWEQRDSDSAFPAFWAILFKFHFI